MEERRKGGEEYEEMQSRKIRREIRKVKQEKGGRERTKRKEKIYSGKNEGR